MSCRSGADQLKDEADGVAELVRSNAKTKVAKNVEILGCENNLSAKALLVTMTTIGFLIYRSEIGFVGQSSCSHLPSCREGTFFINPLFGASC